MGNDDQFERLFLHYGIVFATLCCSVQMVICIVKDYPVMLILSVIGVAVGSAYLVAAKK